MNILDENIRADQRGLLQSWGIPVRQIGVEVGQKGIKDNEIITLLHKLRDTTWVQLSNCENGWSNFKLLHGKSP